VRIIDFGVSALHPFTPTSYQTSYFSFPSASSPISFPTSSTSPPPSGPPFRSVNTDPCIPTPHRSFLCKPVKELYAKPGKIRYMSPELFQGVAWDAFANDVFSLGVILYSLLTGRPPFQQAESSDVWFHVIYTGQWLTPQIRKQPSAHVYTHLSDGALALINMILKPQDMRPTCEQILQHPWMLQTN
jgi:serine/threonine protein kinase